jgi:hypothetical protein
MFLLKNPLLARIPFPKSPRNKIPQRISSQKYLRQYPLLPKSPICQNPLAIMNFPRQNPLAKIPSTGLWSEGVKMRQAKMFLRERARVSFSAAALLSPYFEGAQNNLER